MARRKPNGSAGGSGSTFDPRLVASEAEQMTAAAAAIVQMTDEVSDGADAQVRSFQRMIGSLTQMTTSLAETAGQVESIAASATQLLSSGNEMASSIEQT